MVGRTAAAPTRRRDRDRGRGRGGLTLLAGFGTRIVALVLAIFTLASSVLFRNYWGMPAEQVMVQQLMFFKNIAVVGGLLVLTAHGAGAFSLDGKRAVASRAGMRLSA